MNVNTDVVKSSVMQFSIMLPNQIGALRSLLKLLKKSNIELLGMSITDSSDITILRIVVSDPEATLQIFLEKGIAHTTKDLLVVAFRHTTDDLLACLEAFSHAETNIDLSYALFPNPEGKTLVAFHIDDPEFGRHILTNAGFEVISQDDLSR